MTWRASVLTLFPEMFPGPLAHSLAGRALQTGIWSLQAVNIRDFATDRHRTVDDTPFGGGAGMVLRPDVVDAAIASVADDRPAGVPDAARPHADAARRPAFRRRARHHPAVRPLRRRRPAGDRSARHAGGQHRRLRAVRRRACRAGPARCRGAPAARRDGRCRQRGGRSRSRGTCWNIRTTRARPNGRDGACPTSCSPVITPRSPPGGRPRPNASPANAAPTCGRRTRQTLAPRRLPVRRHAP